MRCTGQFGNRFSFGFCSCLQVPDSGSDHYKPHLRCPESTSGPIADQQILGVTIDYYASARTLAASALAALATYVAVRIVVLRTGRHC